MSTETFTRSYEFGPKLGEGASGAVYRAREHSSGLRRGVAVKILKSEAPTGVERQRLQAEALLLGDLDHPAILRVYSLSRLEGKLALVCEHVDGADLKECIYSDNPPPPRALAEILDLVADALARAYHHVVDGRQLRTVHRDIKPSNLRIDRTGVPKILDFGIAKRHDDFTGRVAAKTETGHVAGTLLYMSPDRFDGQEALPAADVWALGAILYEALAQRPLYAELGDPIVVFGLSQHRGRYEAFVDEQLARLPDATDEIFLEILRRCLAFLPSDRPEAAEVSGWFREAVDHLEGLSARQWATSREWPSPSEEPGPLTGRVLTDTTLTSVPPPEPTSPPGHELTEPVPYPATHPPPAPTSGLTYVLASGMALGLAVLPIGLFGAAFGVYGTLGSRAGPGSEVPPKRVETAVLEADESDEVVQFEPERVSPPESEPVGDAAEPGPSPSQPQPRPSPPPAGPEPMPTSPVVKSAPSQAAPPEPEQEETARVLLSADTDTTVQLQLRGLPGTRAAIGSHPPGRYEVWAHFGFWSHVDTVELEAGDVIRLRCNTVMQTCAVLP